MFRRFLAGIFLGPALFLGSLAWSGFIALETVFDENRSADVAQELLDNDAVRDQLASNVASALSAALPDAVGVDEAQIDAAALAILDDPRVADLLVGALGRTHGSFLGENDTPTTLDFGPVLDAANEQLAAVSPSLADALTPSDGLSVELPTQRIPNARPIKSFLESVVPPLASVAAGLALVALIAARDRGAVFGKAGRWAIFTAAFYLIVGFGLPALLRLVIPAQAEIFAALVQAVLRTTLTPSLVMAGVGGALLVLSWIWPDPEKAREQRAPEPVPNRPAQPSPRAYMREAHLRTSSSWPTGASPTISRWRVPTVVRPRRSGSEIVGSLATSADSLLNGSSSGRSSRNEWAPTRPASNVAPR